MNFYDFHIGDYTSRTAHLEPMEDLAYRRMLDLYYTQEHALPADVAQIARLIRLKGHEQVIESVLREFFIDIEGEGWMHSRCEEVIKAAAAKRESARKSAGARWDKSERNANAMRTDSGGTSVALPTLCQGNAPSPSPSPSPIPKKDRRGTRLPPNWEPGKEGREFALTLGIAGEAFNTEACRFADYWAAQPGQKGVKTDWPATWRNWLRKSVEFRAAAPGPTFRELDEQRAIARVHETTGGLVSAKPFAPRRDALQEVFDAPRRLG